MKVARRNKKKKETATMLGYNKAGLEMGGRVLLPGIGGMICTIVGFIGLPVMIVSFPVGLIMTVGGFVGAYFCGKKMEDIKKEYD